MKAYRIHIIGGAGSGKTYLAEILSKRFNIPHYDLDELFWENSKASFNKKRVAQERDAMLVTIVHKESWVIEGVYYGWLEASFINADLIILLRIRPLIRQIRIIRRFIGRKTTVTPLKKKETFKSLLDLIKWNHTFDKRQMPEIMELIAAYSNKCVIIYNKSELRQFLSSFFE